MLPEARGRGWGAARGGERVVWLKGGDNNIFTQIGLVVLVGLAAKNAILIVEFANEEQRRGLTKLQAVREAALVRLRPVLMTSAATICAC